MVEEEHIEEKDMPKVRVIKMKTEKEIRPWGWASCFAKTDTYTGKILFITQGEKAELKGSICCIEGRANVTIKKDKSTDILLLTPSYYYELDVVSEVEAKENTLLVLIEDTRNEN